MNKFRGIAASPGITIGKAVLFEKTAAVLNNSLIIEAEIATEIERFDKAVSQSLAAIEAIINSTQLSLSEEDLAILETQLELIGDPQIREDIIERISQDKKNAAVALTEVIANTVAVFESMDDEYLQARSADVKDIGNRILSYLTDTENVSNTFPPGSILIAHDLAPSDTITLDTQSIAGFITGAGSRTSHTAIIAKSKAMPAIVGCGSGINEIKNDDLIILDGLTGDIFVNPDINTIADYEAKADHFKQHTQKLKQLKNIQPVTTDGVSIRLSANISSADDLDAMFENGGEGVGLLRTEMLFMDRESLPDEDEQFSFYQKIVLQAKGKPVIVRTIDIGGDKHLPYLNLAPELNPFLGYRAIRICLDRKELFLTQLRAILKASAFGDLKIMFPMISNLEEVRRAKQILSEAKTQLQNEQVAFDAEVQIGIMIEIPSAAVMADILAKEVDFFSIGTNDLCQYTLAVDRMNEKISHLYDPYNPGVLRLIHNVIGQARKHHIHVGMCGEMASDPLATRLLLGMGLEEFSMSAGSIPDIKNIVINSTMSQAKEALNKVMAMDNSAEIISYLKHLHHDH